MNTGFFRKLFIERKVLWTLFGVSLFLHLLFFGAMFFHYGPLGFYLSRGGVLDGNDGQHYIVLAKNMAEGHGYSRFVDPPYEPDAFRTPLLSFYFLPFFAVGGLGLLWLAMAMLNVVLVFTPIVVYKFSRFFLSHTFATVSAMVFAFDPLFLYRSQLAEPDALFVLLMLIAVYFCFAFWRTASAKYFYFTSLVLGLAILLKPTAMYIAALMFLFQVVFVIAYARREWFSLAKNIVIGIIILGAVVSPWLIRNKEVFGVWGISTVGGYNLYEFYTAHEKLPNEQVPQSILSSSREPARYLPNQKYFTATALERIRHSPLQYTKEQLIGSVRNIFVSELPVIYYYGDTAILPFPYNPESGTMGPLAHIFVKIAWFAVIGMVYTFSVLGWFIAWKKDRKTFLAFTLFLAIFAYLIVASGTYVDAKYRMPAMPLVCIMALFGLSWLLESRRKLLRFGLK